MPARVPWTKAMLSGSAVSRAGAVPCVRPPQRSMHAVLRPVLRGGDRRPLPPGSRGGGGRPGAPAAQQQARQLPGEPLPQQCRQHRAEAHHANGPAMASLK